MTCAIAHTTDYNKIILSSPFSSDSCYPFTAKAAPLGIMQTPFLESQPSSRQDRLKKNRSKSSSTIAKKQKAKKAVSASKVKHKPSYDSAYESSSTHDYASVQASPSIQSDQLAPVEPADAELVSPEVYNSWQTPDPQEQTSVHFDDPFASTALPTDARSTFFLHHCKSIRCPTFLASTFVCLTDLSKSPHGAWPKQGSLSA